jgi:Zn-dependent metalloprotease
MKRLVLIIIPPLICGVVLWLASSCNKESNENSNCVKIIKNLPKTTVLSKSEMDAIKYLFNRNQLDYTKYLFTRFQKDELGHSHARCYQFANNLIVFTSDAIFHFDKNDNFYYSDRLISKIDLDTKPSMKQDNVVEKFKDEIEQDGFIMMQYPDIIDGCFELEFGYYDLNAGISYADENYIKAWKIKPTNREYPNAYIKDKNSEIIYYDNGIRY